MIAIVDPWQADAVMVAKAMPPLWQFFPANKPFLGSGMGNMMAIADPSGRRPPDSSAVLVGASACPRSGSTCAPGGAGSAVWCGPRCGP